MSRRGSFALGRLSSENQSALRSVALIERLRDESANSDPRPTSFTIEKDDPRHIDNVRRSLLEAADLTEAQMFAMMQMSPDRRHQSIWHEARQSLFTDAPPFTGAAFFQLKDKGFAHRPEGEKYHTLLPTAMPLAEAVAADLVKRHFIHAFYILHPKEDAQHCRFFCTCGWTHTVLRRGNVQIKAHNKFINHVANVRALERLETALTIAPRRQGADQG